LKKGSRVLDLACGTGYGARIMSETGAHVVSLNLERGPLRRSLSGVQARAEQLPFQDASFDTVVCFEAIEHVAEPARVVDQIARVLRPEGFALLSTPERSIYTDRVGNRNPYHVSEMDRSEFADLLGCTFSHVTLLGQSVWAGSWMARLDESGSPPAGSERHLRVVLDPLAHDATPAPWVAPEEPGFPTPLFLLAFCTRSERVARWFDRRVGAESVLQDRFQRTLGSYLDTLEALQSRDRQIEEFAAHAQRLLARLAEHEERILGLEGHAHNLEEIVPGLRAHAQNLEARVRERDERLIGLEAHAHNLEAHLPRLREHTENLEALLRTRDERVSGLEVHASNLDEFVSHLREHAANLEVALRARDERVSGLEVHAGNLDEFVSHLREHAANLEVALRARDERAAELESYANDLAEEASQARAEAGRLGARCADLEARSERLMDKLGRLERTLQHIRSSFWYRALRWAGRSEDA
jgi:SAM-dependent methyltransferase